jgi:hypothetical protein
VGNFVQVGTTEDEPSLTATEGSYRAFWSSSAVHFHDRDLGSVQAGDTVTAEMIQQPDGWMLTLTDTTHPAAFREATHFDGNQSYSYLRAQWYQEDSEPDVSYPLTQGEYPTTSAVRLTRLRLNGHPPVLPYANARVLVASIQGLVLVPTPVKDNGFALQPASDIQGAYMLAIGPVVADETVLRAEVDNGLQDGAEIAARALSEDLGNAIGVLRARTWPSGATAAIATLIRQLDQTDVRFGNLRHPLQPDPVAVAINDRPLFDANLQVLRTLGLPAPS